MKNLNASILFSYPSYQPMADELLQEAQRERGEFAFKRFPNDELYVTLQTSVNHRECMILGTIAPPDTNLLSFLFLCHTLKKENAAKITAILPYLAYSRHDKNEMQKSYAAALMGELFQRVGINELITFDIHSEEAEKLFRIPIISISSADLFANEILSKSLQNATMIAPDEGAIGRCQAVAKKAEMTRDIAYFKKKRTDEGITHGKFFGEIGYQAIIIDDILDTGGTLISCCERLTQMGVKDISIMVTHGLFTGHAWEKLWELGVKHIYCTNTLPQRIKNDKMTVLSMVPLLKEILK